MITSRNHVIAQEEFQNPYDKKTYVRTYVVTPIETNCYAVINNADAIVIDPGTAGAEIAHNLQDVRIKLIVSTHAHGDHVSGVKALQDSLDYKVPFAVGSYDANRVVHAVSNSNLGLPYDDDAPEPDVLLKAGDKVGTGSIQLEVLHTPGHTEGGIVLTGDELAFTGDTLFRGSAGRTDFPGGDASALQKSLMHLKKKLNPDVIIFPGHGPRTTMRQELATNPFLQ